MPRIITERIPADLLEELTTRSSRESLAIAQIGKVTKQEAILLAQVYRRALEAQSKIDGHLLFPCAVCDIAREYEDEVGRCDDMRRWKRWVDLAWRLA